MIEWKEHVADWELERLMDVVAHPYRDWRHDHPDLRAFGYLCTYAPVEILHAAGFAPIRLMQLSGPVALANAHLPSFACAPARAVTERLLSGQLDFLEGALFGHTCDTMQCMADIWRTTAPRFKVISFSMPTVLSQPSARGYLITELHHLAAVLESEFGTPVTDRALRASIEIYNHQRSLLAEIYGYRACFTAEQLWALTLAGTLTPVEEHCAFMEPLLQTAREAACVDRDGPAVVLIGAVLDDPVIPQLVEELGGRVVGDDLCTGSRYFHTLADETMEPFEALADRYLRRAPCPAKLNTAYPRTERLLSLVRDSGAQGVIFLVPKFCDPHAFDYVALSEIQVPHLLIETDVTVSLGQLRTRIQAFIEMLQGAGTPSVRRSSPQSCRPETG